MRSLSVTLVIAWMLACAGCSFGPTLAPVKGTVTLDGKALAKGTIRFESVGNRAATGRIEDGAIVEVTTFNPGDGAPVGAHKVAVWSSGDASANPADPNYMSGKSLIHALYNDPTTSGLTADIKSGENVLEFKLVATPK